MSNGQRPKNRLLTGLPDEEWAAMRSSFIETKLQRGEVLLRENERVQRLYFPTTCMISAVASFKTGDVAEMSTTGNEGMVPFGAILSSETAISRHLIELPGKALVIKYVDFKRIQRDVEAFRSVLSAYGQAFHAQLMQSVACNSTHSVEERAARWLLMCYDRSGTELRLTQDFLAEMLGVSRKTLNLVARSLQRAGLIRYSRGAISIEDRCGLEEIACECYGIVRRAYDQRLPPPV